jgi:hypothetical protein
MSMRESINDRENQILMTSNTDAKKQTDDSTDKKEEKKAPSGLFGASTGQASNIFGT